MLRSTLQTCSGDKYTSTLSRILLYAVGGIASLKGGLARNDVDESFKKQLQIYIKVAEMMDFGKLSMSSRSFKSFYNAFKKAI